jgi:hypothetical protein
MAGKKMVIPNDVVSTMIRDYSKGIKMTEIAKKSWSWCKKSKRYTD